MEAKYPRWQGNNHPKYQNFGWGTVKGGFKGKGNNFGKGNKIRILEMQIHLKEEKASFPMQNTFYQGKVL